MSIIRREQLTTPLSASYAETASVAISSSYALTASYAENAGVSIDTGSLVTTSSFNAYTASINSFTSSINTFTASYNTGSFTGSFTGNLIGTSSWAENAISSSNALTASYVNPLQQDVQLTGSLLITGSQIIFSGSQFEMTNNIIINPTTRRLNSGSALSVDWGVRGLYSTGNVLSVDWQNRILRVGGNTSVDWSNKFLYNGTNNVGVDWGNSVLYDSSQTYQALNYKEPLNQSQVLLHRTVTTTYNDNLFTGNGTQAGHTITTAVTGSASTFDLVYLSASMWYPADQSTDTSTHMLGIAISVNEDPNKGLVFLEGDITINDVGNTEGPTVEAVELGMPIYIKGGGVGTMRGTPPNTGYVRILGYAYFQKDNGYIMKFRPSNDWYKI
jgi:hypothetical protein